MKSILIIWLCQKEKKKRVLLYLYKLAHLYIRKIHAQKTKGETRKNTLWIFVLLHCQALQRGSELWFFCVLKWLRNSVGSHVTKANVRGWTRCPGTTSSHQQHLQVLPCVILAPHHRAAHDPPHLPAAASRPARFHLHFKYRNLFYWGDNFDSRGRGFPVVKIWGRACNEWRWDLWAEDFLQQPSIPHLSEIGQLLQFRRVRMHTLWNGALISLFCHSANHFPCTSF